MFPISIFGVVISNKISQEYIRHKHFLNNHLISFMIVKFPS
jgi:hypothetical protein